MKKELYHIRKKMTPDKVVETLQKENLSINESEALMLLVFLRKIARIKITAYLENHEHGRGKNS